MTNVLVTGNLTLNGNLYNRFGCATLTDVKASGTGGGSSSTGAFTDRTLNTLTDPSSLITKNADNIRFKFNSTGKYLIDAYSYAYRTDRHKILLTLSDNTEVTVGSSEYSRNGGSNLCTTASYLKEILTVTSTSQEYKIRHFTQTALATTGLGLATNMGQSEMYTFVRIIKIST